MAMKSSTYQDRSWSNLLDRLKVIDITKSLPSGSCILAKDWSSLRGSSEIVMTDYERQSRVRVLRKLHIYGKIK